jgi:hypothetical protein
MADINAFLKNIRGFAAKIADRAMEIKLRVSEFKASFNTFKSNASVTAKVETETLNEVEDLAKYADTKNPFDQFKPEILGE